MKVIIISGILLHILFLSSIFYIYFQSPVLKNLVPENDFQNSPAKRLVLFVIDGLRAESFFDKDCYRTKYLRNIILNGSMMGVSHTRVPTESRPGHVALIAGFYEDPSAVLRGWKENPIEFDSVFNRSRKTFSWGSPDILPMFAKGAANGRVETFSYDPEDEDFSGKYSTSGLDTWVFDRVAKYLEKSENINFLKENDKVVLFLHLLGMDTAGHVHKPHSKLFSQNLVIVDEGIEKIVNLVQKTVEYDDKTAFIVTSDHGMTDRGSHGAGDYFETETPFIAWGAGVKNWKLFDFKSFNHILKEIKGDLVPQWDMKQADVAPLMSSLLGIAVPTNNVGVLPRQYLNASAEFMARAMKNNAFQLYKQYEKWLKISKEKKLQFLLSKNELKYEESLIKLKLKIEIEVEILNFDEVIKDCDKMIEMSLEAIEFYQSYYKDELLFALTLTMLGWIFILLQTVFGVDDKAINMKGFKSLLVGNTPIFFVTCLLLFLIIAINLAQNTPYLAILYFIIPVFTWFPVLVNSKKMFNLFESRLKLTIFVFLSILAIECCVLSFFHRQILSLILLIHHVYLQFSLKRRNLIGNKMKLQWILSTLGLLMFPLLPVVQKDSKNPILLISGTTLWILMSFSFITNKKERKNKFKVFQGILMLTMGINFVFVITYLEKNEGISPFNLILSWIFLTTSLTSSIFSSKMLKDRINAIMTNLSIPFLLMSLSYEPLFFLAFSLNLWYWIRLENLLFSRNDALLDKLSLEESVLKSRRIEADDVRRVFLFMVYLLISFFGTGNMATVSSFDPNWVRCFVTTFSPFLMSSLIILKLMMPILLLVCVLKAIHIVTKVKLQKLFILILIICDIMCLNFLYLIKNKGSWLDIGISISHFVIMECTILVLILLYGVGRLLTEYEINIKGKGSVKTSVNVLLPFSSDKINQD